MATEYKLSYTAKEIDEKLGKIDNILEEAKEYTDSQRIAYTDVLSITWDGKTDGLPVINMGGPSFYKVSDKVLDLSTVINATFEAVYKDGTTTTVQLDQELIFEHEEKLIANELFISGFAGTYTTSDVGTVIIPEDGTYFINFDGNYCKGLYKETIHRIDPRYLPEGGFGYTEYESAILCSASSLTCNEDVGGALIDFIPVAGLEYEVDIDGEKYISNAEDLLHLGVPFIALGNAKEFGSDDNGLPYLIVYVYEDIPDMPGAKGLCMFVHKDGLFDHSVVIRGNRLAIHTINPEYLPAGGFGYTESAKVEVLPETTITGFELNEGVGLSATECASIDLTSICGNIENNGQRKMVVEWDGKQYDTIAYNDYREDDGVDGVSVYYIGNLSYYTIDMENTGEPFLFMGAYFVDTQVVSNDDNESHTVRIFENQEVVHKIDEKYLPEQAQQQNDSLVEQATIGQTIVVKEVDEDGKPTKWEAVDFPSHEGFVKTDSLPDVVFNRITMIDEEGRRYKVFPRDGVLAAMPEDGLCVICGRELLWDSGKRKYVCPSEINTGYCDNCHEPLDENHYCEACTFHTCPECGHVTQYWNNSCEHCGYVFVEGTCSRCGLSSDDGYDAANGYCPNCDGDGGEE